MIARRNEPEGYRTSGPSAAERAFRHIETRLGWEYLPDARLPVEKIALALRMSRQPVRDAVQRLAAEGLVAVIPQVGCIVVRPEREEIADLARLVATADATFVPIAARRAAPADLERLEACARDAERLTAIEWQGCDDHLLARLALRDFFDEIYRIAATRWLGGTVSTMRCRVQTLTMLRFFDLRRDLAPDVACAEARLAAQAAARSLRALSTAFARGDAEAIGRAAYARAMSIVSRADGFASEPLFAVAAPGA